MRLFFAVPLEERVRRAVREAIERSRLRKAPWRWIDPANYHLTLKFLGEVEESALPGLEGAASLAAAEALPFRIALRKFGGFPDLGRPRVLFYELSEGFEELAALAAGIEERCAGIGYERDKRRFRAHLTVARVKTRISAGTAASLSEMEEIESVSQDVGRFVLMSSTLHRTGAVYEEVSSFPLG